MTEVDDVKDSSVRDVSEEDGEDGFPIHRCLSVVAATAAETPL